MAKPYRYHIYVRQTENEGVTWHEVVFRCTNKPLAEAIKLARKLEDMQSRYHDYVESEVFEVATGKWVG